MLWFLSKLSESEFCRILASVGCVLRTFQKRFIIIPTKKASVRPTHRFFYTEINDDYCADESGASGRTPPTTRGLPSKSRALPLSSFKKG